MKITKIPNQIINGKLRPLDLKKVDAIALHHMATDADVKAIERMHINQGWSAIGYNFWVAFDGTVYEGRGFNLGAGVQNQNGHIISVGFQGNYHTKPKDMPDAQFNAGVEVINYLFDKVPTVTKVGGHRDFGATACPGRHFPLNEMKKRKKRGGDAVYYDTVESCPEWAREYVRTAVDKGYITGDENGHLRLNDDKLWALVVCLRINGQK